MALLYMVKLECILVLTRCHVVSDSEAIFGAMKHSVASILYMIQAMDSMNSYAQTQFVTWHFQHSRAADIPTLLCLDAVPTGASHHAAHAQLCARS